MMVVVVKVMATAVPNVEVAVESWICNVYGIEEGENYLL